MRFSIMLSSGEPVDNLVNYAKLAEKCGFYACFVSKDIFKRDAWVILAAIAAQTKEIRLGTSVVNPFSVSPAEIAMSAATLDEYSHGRLLLGISCGIRALSKIGFERKKPVTATKEAVQLIRSLIAGKRTPFQGEIFKGWSDDAQLLFRPIRENIPIYIAANKPKMLQLIGEMGDGGIALTYPPENFANMLRNIYDGAKIAGRDPSTIDVIAHHFGFIDKEEKECWKNVEEIFGTSFWKPYTEKLATFGLVPSDLVPFESSSEQPSAEEERNLVSKKIMSMGMAGTPEDWIKHIEKLHRSFNKQPRHIMVWLRQRNTAEGIKMLGEEVIPYFRQ